MWNLCRGAAALAAVVSLGVAVPVAAQDDEWKVYWKNGTRIESADGDFKIKFGGRIHADFTVLADGDDGIEEKFGELEGGSEFRRARLYVSGELYGRFEFKLDYDFATGDTIAKDVYVGVTDLPFVGGLRIGHFKEPFTLEQLASSNYIAFIERSITDEPFDEGRNMGLMLHNAILDDRLNWAAGIFQPSDGFARYEGSEWNFTGRVSGVPIWQEDGRRLLHLGTSMTRRDPPDDRARLRTRPEVHLAPRFIDTGEVLTDSTEGMNFELAGVWGPFWGMSEYTILDTDTLDFGTRSVSGYKLHLGYYLTGEHRRYKKSEGVWDRQQPKRPFLEGSGVGAWEVLARYTHLDTNDGPIQGGELSNVTLGVNWYLNSASRVMLNWVMSDLDGVGNADFVTLRLQVDF